MTHRYHIDVFWSDEDDCWIANVPDLRPCSAHGDTPVEAVTEVEVAIGMCLEFYRDKGMSAPDAIYQSVASMPQLAAVALTD